MQRFYLFFEFESVSPFAETIRAYFRPSVFCERALSQITLGTKSNGLILSAGYFTLTLRPVYWALYCLATLSV